MSDNPTLREASKQTWGSNGTLEAIQAGALQRIADAVETMSGNYAALIRERDRYKDERDRTYLREAKLERSNRALRAYIKRMKK